MSSGQDPKILIMDFGADIEGIEMLESGLSVPEVPNVEASASSQLDEEMENLMVGGFA